MRIDEYEGSLPLIRGGSAYGQVGKVQINVSAFGVELSETGNSKEQKTGETEHGYLWMVRDAGITRIPGEV
jgi:hypothetical protein